MARIKNTVVSLIAAGCFLFPTFAKGATKYTYEDLDKNKKVLERVEYNTFRSNLDSGAYKQKIENQEEFIEHIINAINTHPELRPELGHNLNRGVNEEEFEKFIFDDVLKGKLNYEIKTSTDVLVGINMVLEHLVKYNKKMTLRNNGLGSDINNDGRFDGIDWASFTKVDKSLQEKISKDPRVGEKIAWEEAMKIDPVPTDLLLMGKEMIVLDNQDENGRGEKRYVFIDSKIKGQKDAVEVVCRNYMSALGIMFETAKKRYPELTKDVELLYMPMPGHIFGAFMNKKTLEYAIIDPTTHDSLSGDGFDIRTFVFPKEVQYHYDCLKDDGFFELIPVERLYFSCMDKYSKEFIFHNKSKKMLKELLPKIRELAKKYPNSYEVAKVEVGSYIYLIAHKEHKKAFKLLKEIYDNKERKEQIGFSTYSWMLIALGEVAFEELKDYKQALSFFEECAKYRIAENNWVDEAMVGIAECHLKLGNYYDALFRAKDILELSPRHHKQAKKVVSKAKEQLWKFESLVDYLKGKDIRAFVKGDYKKAIKELRKKDDAESKLLLAESYASLNQYDNAKSLYEKLKEDKDLGSIAETELRQMNRKFFLYGYKHFFDGRFTEAIEELSFIKSKVTPKEGNYIAERSSLLLIYAYVNIKDPQKALEEADYFLKTFPDSEFAKYIKKTESSGGPSSR